MSFLIKMMRLMDTSRTLTEIRTIKPASIDPAASPAITVTAFPYEKGQKSEKYVIRLIGDCRTAAAKVTLIDAVMALRLSWDRTDDRHANVVRNTIYSANSIKAYNRNLLAPR